MQEIPESEHKLSGVGCATEREYPKSELPKNIDTCESNPQNNRKHINTTRSETPNPSGKEMETLAGPKRNIASTSPITIQDCNIASIPMNNTLPIDESDCPNTDAEKADMKNVPYQQAIGCLMYLSQCTRPDIPFAVNKLSRYNSYPGKKHWDAVKDLFCFLKATKLQRLIYQCQRGYNQKLPEIVGYVDANHAKDEDSKSVSGYVFIAEGGAISWNSRKQTPIALSRCESQFIALTKACQDAKRWNGLIREIGYPTEPMKIFCDSQPAITLSQSEAVNKKDVAVSHVPSHSGPNCF